MRGVLAAALCLAIPRLAAAQAANYEPIRVDFGLLGAYAEDTSAGGFGGMIEPKYLLADNIALGLRLEGQVIFGADVDRGDDEVGLTSGSVGAVLARGEYLVGAHPVRPVVGLGAGLYSIGGQESSSSADGVGVSQSTGRYFGLAPQVALDLGRVRFAVTYNAILGAAIEVEQTVGDPSTIQRFSQSYYTFELSFHVGGSRLSAR